MAKIPKDVRKIFRIRLWCFKVLAWLIMRLTATGRPAVEASSMME